jgi:hypothetical protein
MGVLGTKAIPQMRDRSPRPLAKLEAGSTKRQLLKCGGKRSATPLFFCEQVSVWKKRRRRFALPAQSKIWLRLHSDR